MRIAPGSQHGMELQQMALQVSAMPAVRKADLHAGDVVMVDTFNSQYMIRVLGGGLYSVSGGWFDRKGAARQPISIAGCTWGGSVIKIDIVAACGLCIEFGNRVRTSMVRRIAVFPSGVAN